MDLIQAIVLAVVQGFTEFLPISSSAHLILVPNLLGWPDQGIAFDVAVHVGTLAAVTWYFRQELIAMATDGSRALIQRRWQGESRLAWYIIIGTLPAGIAGLAFKDLIEHQLRSPMVIAIATLIFGLALWFADAKGRRQRGEDSLNLKDVIIIGLAQAIALIPGTSRSGITITAALLLGLKREAAARFSFLLSIPLIAAAGALKLKDLLEESAPVDWLALGVGTILSALSAYLCIKWFLALLNRMGMAPFIIYRMLLGVFLLLFFW